MTNPTNITLQILVPQYNENDDTVKSLLDSIAFQRGINFQDLEVIICNDGSEVHLSDKLLNSYPFKIHYYLEPHRGVSGTRNACLDYATAEYICYCDADDMFATVYALWTVFSDIKKSSFDILVDDFLEEIYISETNEMGYVKHTDDCTFVHGKFYRRGFLLEQNIRWNEELTIHEDGYFNLLCRKLAKQIRFCETPLYLWKWRDDSVSRRDNLYNARTLTNRIDSGRALTREFIKRKMIADAKVEAFGIIYEAYCNLNSQIWQNKEAEDFKANTYAKVREFYQEFKTFIERLDPKRVYLITQEKKKRSLDCGLIMLNDCIDFNKWIQTL